MLVFIKICYTLEKAFDFYAKLCALVFKTIFAKTVAPSVLDI